MTCLLLPVADMNKQLSAGSEERRSTWVGLEVEGLMVLEAAGCRQTRALTRLQLVSRESMLSTQEKHA